VRVVLAVDQSAAAGLIALLNLSHTLNMRVVVNNGHKWRFIPHQNLDPFYEAEYL
jgi:hypothetical protein